MAIQGPHVEVTIGANLSPLQRAMGQATAEMDMMARKIQRIGIGLTATFGIIGAASAKALTEVEYSTAQIATLMDEVSLNTIPRMRDEIVEMSVRFGQSFESMAKARYDVVSAGFRDIAKSATVMGAASELALAGAAEVGPTARLVVQALRAYGLEAEKATYISDLLFQTVKIGLTTIPELGEALGRIFSTARAANVSLEELQATVSVLTVITGNTNESVNALNRLLFAMAAPTGQAAEAMRKAGIEVQDSEGNIKSLIQVISQFRGMNLGMIKELIGGRINAAKAMAILSQNTQLYVDALNQMTTAVGTAREAAALMAEQTLFKWRQLREGVNALRVEIGKAIDEDVKDFIKALHEIVQGITSWVEKNDKLVGSIIAIGFRVGVLTLSVSLLARAVSGLIKILSLAWLGQLGYEITKIVGVSGFLKKSFDAVNYSAIRLGGSFSGLAISRIPPVGIAIGGLVAGLGILEIVLKRVNNQIEEFYREEVTPEFLGRWKKFLDTKGVEQLQQTTGWLSRALRAHREMLKKNIETYRDFELIGQEAFDSLWRAIVRADKAVRRLQIGEVINIDALQEIQAALQGSTDEIQRMVDIVKIAAPAMRDPLAHMFGFRTYSEMLEWLEKAREAIEKLGEATTKYMLKLPYPERPEWPPPTIPLEYAPQAYEAYEATINLADAWNILTNAQVRAIASATQIYNAEQMIFAEGADMFSQLAQMANRANADVTAAFFDLISNILNLIKIAQQVAAGGQMAALIPGIGGVLASLMILSEVARGRRRYQTGTPYVQTHGVGHNTLAWLRRGEVVLSGDAARAWRGGQGQAPLSINMTFAPQLSLEGATKPEAQRAASLIALESERVFVKRIKDLRRRGVI